MRLLNERQLVRHTAACASHRAKAQLGNRQILRRSSDDYDRSMDVIIVPTEASGNKITQSFSRDRINVAARPADTKRACLVCIRYQAACLQDRFTRKCGFR